MISFNPITARLARAFHALRTNPTIAPLPAPAVLPVAPVTVNPARTFDLARHFPASRDFLVRVIRDPEFANGGIDDTRTDVFDGIDDVYVDDADQSAGIPDTGADDPYGYSLPIIPAYARSRARWQPTRRFAFAD